MAWRFVKQPNGLLARFSDVVDNFTDLNLTSEAAIALCLYKHNVGLEDAKEKVNNALRDIIPWTTKEGSGLDRWKDCLETIQFVHGEQAIAELMKEYNENPSL